MDEDKLILRGSSSSGNANGEKIACDVPSSEVLYGFGNESGLSGVLTRDGELMFLEMTAVAGEGNTSLRRRAVLVLEGERKTLGGEKIGHLAIAGNGRVCVSFGMLIWIIRAYICSGFLCTYINNLCLTMRTPQGSTVVEYPSLPSLFTTNPPPSPTRHILSAPPPCSCWPTKPRSPHFSPIRGGPFIHGAMADTIISDGYCTPLLPLTPHT